jgi:hypothetical protein
MSPRKEGPGLFVSKEQRASVHKLKETKEKRALGVMWSQRRAKRSSI